MLPFPEVPSYPASSLSCQTPYSIPSARYSLSRIRMSSLISMVCDLSSAHHAASRFHHRTPSVLKFECPLQGSSGPEKVECDAPSELFGTAENAGRVAMFQLRTTRRISLRSSQATFPSITDFSTTSDLTSRFSRKHHSVALFLGFAPDERSQWTNSERHRQVPSFSVARHRLS